MKNYLVIVTNYIIYEDENTKFETIQAENEIQLKEILFKKYNIIVEDVTYYCDYKSSYPSRGNNSLYTHLKYDEWFTFKYIENATEDDIKEL